jgi:hypothetical protein
MVSDGGRTTIMVSDGLRKKGGTTTSLSHASLRGDNHR